MVAICCFALRPPLPPPPPSWQNADTIVVLDKGQVAESGTHAELMAAGGVYRDLVARQLLQK